MTTLTPEEAAEVELLMNQIKQRFGCDLVVMAFHRQARMEYFKVASHGTVADYAAKHLLKCMADGVDSLNAQSDFQSRN